MQDYSSKEMQAAINISHCGLGAFAAALLKGVSGDQIIYHIGKKCGGAHKREAQIAAQFGLVLLTSKRTECGKFEFIATIASKLIDASPNERRFLLGSYLFERASSLGELHCESSSTLRNLRCYLRHSKICITDEAVKSVLFGEEIVNRKAVKLVELMSRFGLKSSRGFSSKAINEFEAELNSMDIGIAPHPYLVRREQANLVIAFRTNSLSSSWSDQSQDFLSALIAVVLAASLLSKGDRLTEQSKQRISGMICARYFLNEHEQCHVAANLDWFFTFPPSNSVLLTILRKSSAKGTRFLRRIMSACADEMGKVDSALVAHLEDVYKLLWLDANLVYSDLHEGDVADEPVTVRAVQTGPPGEAIPEPDKASGPKLDASRIAAIRSDTEHVSSVLGQIFDVEEEERVVSAPANQSQLAGLEPKHGTLVLELVAREHWYEAEFEKICASHGLMASGALEIVNEWAFETYDEALLEEHDGYDVSPHIAEAVKEKVSTEGRDV